MNQLRSGKFKSELLEKVTEANYAVLASGGPLMRVLGVFQTEAGELHVVCSIEGDKEPRLFNPKCLRTLTIFDPLRWLS